MKGRWTIVCLGLFANLLLGNECYDSQKIWLVLRIGGRARIFETKADWVFSGGELSELYSDSIRWFARNSEGVLHDWELMNAVGLTDVGEKLRLHQEHSRKLSTVGLIVGVPLGLAMLGGSVAWGYDIWQREKPSTIDVAGAVVLGFGGLGVFLASISNYKRYHKPPDIAEHQISAHQAVDLVDRYNTSLKIKCGISIRGSGRQGPR